MKANWDIPEADQEHLREAAEKAKADAARRKRLAIGGACTVVCGLLVGSLVAALYPAETTAIISVVHG